MYWNCLVSTEALGTQNEHCPMP